jgi:hypothetical protein
MAIPTGKLMNQWMEWAFPSIFRPWSLVKKKQCFPFGDLDIFRINMDKL